MLLVPLLRLAPLKGIPSRGLNSFSRSSFGNLNRSGARSLAGHKEGGIKLLDITEQPFGVGLSAAAKKKIRLDAEAAEKAAAAAAKSSTTELNTSAEDSHQSGDGSGSNEPKNYLSGELIASYV